jgi:hypothetical protein
MKKLIWIGTILVAAIFLSTNICISNVYGCANSTNTNHTAGVNVTSGNITKSEFTSSSQISDVADKIPVGQGPCGVASAPNGQHPY